jgi:hypothetical protein
MESPSGDSHADAVSGLRGQRFDACVAGAASRSRSAPAASRSLWIASRVRGLEVTIQPDRRRPSGLGCFARLGDDLCGGARRLRHRASILPVFAPPRPGFSRASARGAREAGRGAPSRDRIASIAPPPSTTLTLSTGVGLEVAGSLQEVEKLLQNAARSSPGTLAWLKDAHSGERVGVNPAHVLTLRAAAGGPER